MSKRGTNSKIFRAATGINNTSNKTLANSVVFPQTKIVRIAKNISTEKDISKCNTKFNLKKQYILKL